MYVNIMTFAYWAWATSAENLISNGNIFFQLFLRDFGEKNDLGGLQKRKEQSRTAEQVDNISPREFRHENETKAYICIISSLITLCIFTNVLTSISERFSLLLR